MYRLMLRKKSEKLDSEIEEKLEKLLAIGRLGNFHPLLIACYQKYEDDIFSKEEFMKILDRIETFIFRIYSAKQRPANAARIPFYQLARKVHKEKNGGIRVNDIYLNRYDAKKIISTIEKEIHKRCNNNDLKEIMQRVDFFNYYGSSRKNELRYLLYLYEKTLEDKYEGLTPPLLPFVKNSWKGKPSGEEITIEHIWPQSDNKLKLTKKEKQIHENYKHKLGNLAYMTGPWNSQQQNNPVNLKLEAYKKSKIRMLGSIAKIIENEGWGKDQINNREEIMINKIIEIWPDPLSIKS